MNRKDYVKACFVYQSSRERERGRTKSNSFSQFQSYKNGIVYLDRRRDFVGNLKKKKRLSIVLFHRDWEIWRWRVIWMSMKSLWLGWTLQGLFSSSSLFYFFGIFKIRTEFQNWKTQNSPGKYIYIIFISPGKYMKSISNIVLKF